MVRMVCDSSALILLAKCSLLETVCDFFELVIPSTVIAEVATEDLVRTHPDAALISDLISQGKIRVHRNGNPKLTVPISLHQGEQDALFLAMELKGSILATDDGKAIKAARFLKLPFIITPKIVVEFYELRKISFKKARESLEKLGIIGRYSPEIIAEALVSLMEEKDGKADDHQDTG
jgi:predicted nucleic acid-binding protein